MFLLLPIFFQKTSGPAANYSQKEQNIKFSLKKKNMLRSVDNKITGRC